MAMMNAKRLVNDAPAPPHEVLNAEKKSTPAGVSSVASVARKVQQKSGALNMSSASIGKQKGALINKQIQVHQELAKTALTPAHRMIHDAASYKLRLASGDAVAAHQITPRSSFVGVKGDAQSHGMSAATQVRLGLQAWRKQAK